MEYLKGLYQKYQDYKKYHTEGYDLAEEIDELVTLYGRENCINKNIDEKDKERLENITYKLVHMYGDGVVKCFFMSVGFQRYQNKTAWKRLKEALGGKDATHNKEKFKQIP